MARMAGWLAGRLTAEILEYTEKPVQGNISS
jgi:hypothetical protein